MSVLTLILAFLALPVTTFVAAQDTLRVRAGVDTVQVCAPAVPDSARLYVPAEVDSVQLHPPRPFMGISTNIP